MVVFHFMSMGIIKNFLKDALKETGEENFA